MNTRPTVKERLLSYVAPTEAGCWIWTGYTSKIGYGQIGIGRQVVPAHRAAWAAFNGPIPFGKKVLHTCDVRDCINPEHLFLGDQLDNIKDMVRKGRHTRGESHAYSTLTEDIVRAIRAEHASGAPAAQIARQRQMSYRTVYGIIRRERWAHVD